MSAPAAANSNGTGTGDQDPAGSARGRRVTRGGGPVEGGTDAVAARLHLVTTRLARRLRQEAAADLTPSQLSALASVSRHGPVTLGALADVERVAPPTVTRIVAKLESAGLVARRADTEDRRVTRVVASPAGERLLAESRRRKVAWLADRLDALPMPERRRIAAAVAALERLADSP